MKNILKTEETGMFILGCFAFSQLSMPWWVFLVFFLAPDIGMLGYLVNPRTGAFSYNFLHHKGVAVTVWITGVLMNIEALALTGIILFAHSSFDRMVGYGLKYPDSFHHTHLGIIGKTKPGN